MVWTWRSRIFKTTYKYVTLKALFFSSLPGCLIFQAPYKFGRNILSSFHTRKLILKSHKFLVLFPVLHIRKELESHQSIVTSKILNRLKNHNSFWICKRGEDIGQFAAPMTGEKDRWIQRVVTYQSRDSWVENTLRTHAQVEKPNCNWWAAEDPVWTSLRIKNVRGTQL